VFVWRIKQSTDIMLS